MRKAIVVLIALAVSSSSFSSSLDDFDSYMSEGEFIKAVSSLSKIDFSSLDDEEIQEIEFTLIDTLSRINFSVSLGEVKAGSVKVNLNALYSVGDYLIAVQGLPVVIENKEHRISGTTDSDGKFESDISYSGGLVKVTIDSSVFKFLPENILSDVEKYFLKYEGAPSNAGKPIEIPRSNIRKVPKFDRSSLKGKRISVVLIAPEIRRVKVLRRLKKFIKNQIESRFENVRVVEVLRETKLSRNVKRRTIKNLKGGSDFILVLRIRSRNGIVPVRFSPPPPRGSVPAFNPRLRRPHRKLPPKRVRKVRVIEVSSLLLAVKNEKVVPVWRSVYKAEFNKTAVKKAVERVINNLARGRER